MEGALRVARRLSKVKHTVRAAQLTQHMVLMKASGQYAACQQIQSKGRRSSRPAACTLSKMGSIPDETTALLGRRTRHVVSESEQHETFAAGRKSFDDARSDPTNINISTDCYSTFHNLDDTAHCAQRHSQLSLQGQYGHLSSIRGEVLSRLSSSAETGSSKSCGAYETSNEHTEHVEEVTADELLATTASTHPQFNQSSDSLSYRDRTQPCKYPPTSAPTLLPTYTSLRTVGMSDQISNGNVNKSPAKEHKPLVVGRTKPQPPTMATSNSGTKAVLNEEIAQNVETNTSAAAPAEGTPKPKKEKAPKQPKAPKAAPPTAPLSPALIDLRVGHILRAINHPNADSLYVSTIAMGDPEGTEHTQVDEATGKVVRTVCSGLNGLVPLADMQDRTVIVVANLKPVNMRSIKSAAMVLAASPRAEEGADPHAPDRVVELVSPPEGAEAGEPVFFEGWTYGEGKGPEKVLNPKKKQWEAIQPGFYTSEDLVVGFDAGKSEVEGEAKGDLVVEGKGKCTVKTLKGAVVR